MKTLFSLLFASLALTGAHAQVAELYGTLAVNHASSLELLPYSSTQFVSYTTAGFSGGGTFNFIPLHVLNVGIDVNGTRSSGVNLWLAGIQIKAKPPLVPIKPYFKIAVGEAYFHAQQNFTTMYPSTVPVDYYIYNASLGVDYRLNHFVDVRLLEVGDGRTLGGGSTNPTALLTLRSGIVIHP